MADVVLTITVDWEGLFLNPRDLKAMLALYAQLDVLQDRLGAAIALTHFICPAYFTRTDNESTLGANQELLLSALTRKQDEIGAHVHSWKSLFLESGIADKNIKLTPVGQNITAPAFSPGFSRGKTAGVDIGYQVPFGAYSQEEISRVLQTTVDLLRKYLKADPVSFRCGCWVTCDGIFRALASAGLQNDASAVPFNYITNVIRGMRGDTSHLTAWLVKIWGPAQVTSPEPYLQNSLSFAQYPNGILGAGDAQISEPAIVNGIVELPDTAMLLPWSNQALMNAHIDRAFDIAERTGRDVYISLGFHQETCGTPSGFEVTGFPSTTEEKEVQLNGILGAVAHAVSKSLRSKVPVKFIQKTALAENLRRIQSTTAADAGSATAQPATLL